MVRRRRPSSSLNTGAIISVLKLKKMSLPTLALGVGLGTLIGGHFFDPPAPPLYQLADKTRLLSCFTPQHQCLPLILQEVNKAQKEILVQAFSFTSQPLTSSLKKARARGVRVCLIVDKTQDTTSNQNLFSLKRAGVDIFVDTKPAIAHNKLIIIDGTVVIGGSYNYSEAAEYSNTENVMILINASLAQNYRNNWLSRLKVSRRAKAF